jgi:CHAT domain-containing protein
LVKSGFEYCLKGKFTEALNNFQKAQKLFISAGNNIEAQTICLHFIAYCRHNNDDQKMARELFQEVNDFCEEKNYKWFYLMNLDWLMGSQEALTHKSFTEIETIYEDALKEAEKINDNFTTQKILLTIIKQSNFLKNENQTFSKLHKLFNLLKKPNLSERQKLRIFDKAIPILALSSFHSFAKEAVLESLEFVKPASDSSFQISSYLNAGIVYLQSSNLKESEEWFDKALADALVLKEKASKQNNLAKIFLQKGHLEKKKNNAEKAIGFYNKTLEIVKTLTNPALLYEVQKSRLLTYQETGNDAEVEEDIYSVLQLAEKYREKISDENERSSFFDEEQDIYDLAVEHKLRLNQNEQAYYYSEISNSRSLLDWLTKGGKISGNNQNVKVIFDDSGKPLQVEQIRKNIPPNVQLLQYSVVSDKVLIGVISKDKLTLTVSAINAEELSREMENYLSLIKDKKTADDISNKLYNYLILPVLPQLDKNNEICIIPDKGLFKLPFASLISQTGTYLLEDFNLVYSTSANVFVHSTQKAKNLNKIIDERILSVGNPAFDNQRFSNLKNLPEAEKEADFISQYYRNPLVLNNIYATKEAFQNNYQDFEVIHFGGHYIVEPEYPLFSKLMMTKDTENEKNSFITNADLLEKTLPQTKLVVLAACQTGSEKYSAGEGLIGLSRTFLALGVPIVVAGQWDVDSEATAELMRLFHLNRREKKLSSSQALRLSQLELLKTEGENFRNPYFWAGFAIYGGYAEF